jgi:transposase
VLIESHKRSKKNGRKAVPKELPRERIEYEPEEAECSCCGEKLVKIGEEVTEELDYIPARFMVIEHVRIKKACSKCEGGSVLIGTIPPDTQAIEKGRAGAGLLSHVYVSKYCDHLPLFRQEQIYAREGVELRRSTLCDWVRQGADLLEPIAKEILRQVLAYPAIYADETLLKVQDKEKTGLHQGYMWNELQKSSLMKNEL